MAESTPKSKGETSKAPPLTVDTVMRAVHGVRDWKEFGDWLFFWSGISDWATMLRTIQQQHNSDGNYLHAVVEQWFKGHQQSWRQVIYALDWARERVVADSIRGYAEPPPDTTVTLDRVAAIMDEIKNLGRVRWRLGVPRHMVDHLSDREKKHAVSNYYLQTHPRASWEDLIEGLYYEQFNAVEKAKQHLPKADPTLTTSNILGVLSGLEERWEELGEKLEVLPSKRNEIRRHQGGSHQSMRALFTFYIRYHHAPSWQDIASVLQKMGLHDLADVVTTKYVRVTMSDDEAQAIVDQALESGSLEQRNTVAVVVGIAGSGKTWLISRIFRTNPPGRYTSTGIAEKSLRGLMHRIARMDSLELLTPDNILEFLAPFFQGGLPKADIASLAKTFTEEETLEPIQASSGEALSLSQPTTSPAAISSSTTASSVAHSLPEKSYASEAMISLVQRVKGTKKALIKLLYMIDTGGQPEFMEIMPSLIHNSNLMVLVVNLAHSLDEYPFIAFYEEGTAYKQHLPSALTIRQVIHQLACTLQAKRLTYTGSQQSKVSIIGTHRDCVKDKLSETLAAVNKELKSLFVPAMENELIVYRSCDEIIFPVNLLNPDDNDEEVLELIRQKIIDADIGQKAEIPVSFFLFEQEAILYAEDRKGKGRQVMVLSFDECVQVGARLKMSGEIVQAALIYFHCHNIFLYFQHVLPNLVFLSPQVPLDFVNAIVALSYKVKSGSLPAILAKYERFCKEGIITEEMLCDNGLQLSDCFISGIYEPQHAIKLFLHTYTIAQLSTEESVAKTKQPPTHSGRPGQKSSTMKQKEYLMMSLLAAIPEKDIQKLLPSCSKVDPLVIHFSSGCVPNGCFGNIISCLISTYNWKLCRTEQTSPECLAHNIVKLCDPKLPVTITMVNLTRHLEIHVNMDKVEEQDVKAFCLSIHKKNFAAVDRVFKVMRFQDVQVEPAFLCPCECNPSHATRICPGSSYMVCSKTRNPLGSLQRKQQVWFQDGGKDAHLDLSGMSLANHPDTKEGYLSEEDLTDITDYLLPLEKTHIYNLGLVLGISQHKTKAMMDSSTFLDDVIAAWLRREDQVKKKGEPSWTVLVTALEHPRVGQCGISQNIRKEKGLGLKFKK